MLRDQWFRSLSKDGGTSNSVAPCDPTGYLSTESMNDGDMLKPKVAIRLDLDGAQTDSQFATQRPPHSSLRGRTPHEVYTETEPCSSRPGLTMSGAGTVQ